MRYAAVAVVLVTLSPATQAGGVSLPAATSTQSSPPPQFGQNPELRGQIVAYLSDSGLSEADGERIADEALDGLKDCVEDAFGSYDAGIRDNILQACMLNVLADYGLPVGNASSLGDPHALHTITP